MHGLVNRTIQTFVTETYGERAWLAVARGSGAEIADFESLSVYDDPITDRMMDTVELVLQKPRARILEDIGTWLIASRQPDTVRRLLRFGGVNFVEFLHSLDDLPGRVRMAVDNLDLPNMELEETASGTYRLTLYSKRIGFGSVMLGLLRAMADDYGALTVIEAVDSPAGRETLAIQLFETDYAEGRDFLLAKVQAWNMMVENTYPLDAAALDRLMPMHLVIGPTGHIRQAGTTICKLAPDGLVGRQFTDVFEPRRPRNPRSVADLAGAEGGRLSMVLRGGYRTSLKGQAVALAGGGVFVNLSLGIAVLDAVAHHGLTATDFAPTDLTIEMLYLVEAKSAVVRESQKLNDRLKDAKREAETQALSDALTGLGNRRAMDEALTRLIAQGEPFGLMHLDLDFFKAVNDSLGHAAGDHVLAEVAQVLREVTRTGDVVSRIGGDEFVLILRGFIDRAALLDLGRRLIARLEAPISWQGQTCRISGSVGVSSTALYRRPDTDRMLSDADEALYASKRAGRGTVTMVEASGVRA